MELKAKYPNIHYHVFDASSGYWRTRNDYPHYLLYQDGDEAKETLENWQPTGANPFYGSIDGRFTAPKEIHALGNVPPGSTAGMSQLAAMLNNGNLREIFGSEIAGIPTETVLAITQAQVWGGGAIL